MSNQTPNINDPDESPILDELASSAPSLVRFWLAEADLALSEKFGPDYADKHPAVVGGFIAACATTYQAGLTAAAMNRIEKEILRLARVGCNAHYIGLPKP